MAVLFAITFVIGFLTLRFLVIILTHHYYVEVPKKQANFINKLKEAPYSYIEKDLELFTYAKTEGQEIFVKMCVSCHGSVGQGKNNVPPLAQGKLLRNGKLKDVARAIRNGYEGTYATPMFGYEKQLKRQEISDVADYILSLSGKTEDTAAIERGKKVYITKGCVVCHNFGGKEFKELGVSSLSDNNWLYGGTKNEIMESIRKGRVGLSHAWKNFLEDTKIKMLAAYVWSLR
jgi:cytochrome c oxidase cbb3-type subunit 3